MKKNTKNMLEDFIVKISNDNLNIYAASTAFFVFLSLVPMLLMIFNILPYTPVKEEDFLELINTVTPAESRSYLMALINEVYEKSIGKISITALFIAWSAAKGVHGLMRGLNAVNQVNDSGKFLILRLKSIMYTIVFSIAVIISLIIMVFGKVITNLILSKLPRLESVFTLGLNLRYLLVLVLLTLIFVSMYVVIPNKKLKFRYQLPGAFFSAVLWILFSWAFSIYVNNFGAFNMYGSLGTIIIVLLWLYFCMFILLLGANLNRYLKPAFQYFYSNRKSREKNLDMNEHFQ